MMVVGNASGREDGEGQSGVKTDEYEESMEYEQGGAHVSYHTQGAYPVPMVNSPSHGPRAYQPSLMFSPLVPISPLPRSLMQVQNHALIQSTENHEDVVSEKLKTATITWRHGGKQVAIIGSWDNWETITPMHHLNEEYFIFTKMLPSGVYHYRFLVDEQWCNDPKLPCGSDGSGGFYNILDLQDYVPEAVFNLAEFEPPPSPDSSYDNKPLDYSDFTKPPPDLPPQLQETFLNELSSFIGRPFTLPRPPHLTLNHLYIQVSADGQPVALGSTFRFDKTYVNVVL